MAADQLPLPKSQVSVNVDLGGGGVGGQEPRNLNWSPLYPETLNSLSNRDGDDNENFKKHKII